MLQNIFIKKETFHNQTKNDNRKVNESFQNPTN